jgi:hypothetical protein
LSQVSTPAKALQILAYAVKHDDEDLANLAAQHTINISPTLVFEALPGKQFLEWVTSLFYLAQINDH